MARSEGYLVRLCREWVKVLGIMGGFVAKSPVRIARGMLTYRWMGSYLAALNMIDRCVEGLRGPALRVAPCT